VSGDENNGLTSWMKKRLDQVGAVLGEREWLAASRFTVADILMADVLRVPDVRAFSASPSIEAYIERAMRKARVQEGARRSTRPLRGGGQPPR
jgi:glutathione S-transferase